MLLCLDIGQSAARRGRVVVVATCRVAAEVLHDADELRVALRLHGKAMGAWRAALRVEGNSENGLRPALGLTVGTWTCPTTGAGSEAARGGERAQGYRCDASHVSR